MRNTRALQGLQASCLCLKHSEHDYWS